MVTDSAGAAYKQAANTIAASAECDVLLLNGPILRPLDVTVAQLCAGRQRRSNVLFVLVTQGGDADPAYRIARCLQEAYDRFSFFVTGYCKSAGTLVATGANEIVVADCGELGPLDVQMSKEDELGETRSGLTVLSALSILHAQAFDAFEYFLLETKRRSAGTITTRTAIRVATDLAGKLLAPIYEHVDAMHVGEAGRSLEIAVKYGEILGGKGRNLKSKALDRLTQEYPSHGFVIDRLQAEKLFGRVRSPNSTEIELANLLGDVALTPIPHPQEPLLAFLNDEAVAQTPSFLSLDRHSTGDDHDDEETTRTVADGSSSERTRDSGSDPASTEQNPSGGLREIGAGIR